MDQLNSGILPCGCFAMAEQIIGGPEPDVVALKLFDNPLSTLGEQYTNAFRSVGNAAVLAEAKAKPKVSDLR